MNIKDKFRSLPVETVDALSVSDDNVVEFIGMKPMSDQPGFDGILIPFYTLADRGVYFVPGSMKKTAKEHGLKSPHLLQHDDYQPIGKHNAVKETPDGLVISVSINEAVPAGAELMSNLRFGVPMGLSAGIQRITDRSGTPEDDKILNRKTAPWLANVPINELQAITEARMLESSSVTFAAFGLAAKPTEIRSALLNAGKTDPTYTERLDAILTALKAGDLTAEELAALTELVAAFQTHAAAGETHDTSEDEQARQRLKRRQAEFAITRARFYGLLPI